VWGGPSQVRLRQVVKPPLYPLIFEPRFKERVWGGRRLETLYGKPLPPDVPIGESWEISDRPGDESVIANGPLAGRTLRSLMEERRGDVVGSAAPTEEGRFPLLCKILDARQKLSLQVHPPERAKHLGEPKTEMWYIADADPGAELFVGLKRGVDRTMFEEAIGAGRVAECFHRIEVKSGDAMFLPSGRVHAIGAGLVIFEIQQNSDTTFRVHDWDRMGLDGKPRELHVTQSLESIDFSDIEPGLLRSPLKPVMLDDFGICPLVRDPLFEIDLIEALGDPTVRRLPMRARVIACVRGRLTCTSGPPPGDASQTITAGQFCLIPAVLPAPWLVAERGTILLIAHPGAGEARWPWWR
jgi:mannose-6-phosphate isomerase